MPHRATPFTPLSHALVFILVLSLNIEAAASNVLHREKSLYQNIIVSEQNDKRCLVFSVKRQQRDQTCKDMTEPNKIVFPYVRMTLAGLLINPNPQSILMIGLGGGTIANVLTDLYPVARIDLVEVDQAIVKVARDYFDFRETAFTTVHTIDGRVYTRRAQLNLRTFDLIILDAFNGEYIPEHLMTEEFLSEIRSLLSTDGVVVANTFASSALYDHESVTYEKVFGDLLNFKMPGTGNRVIVASAQALPNAATLKRNAAYLMPLLSPYSVDSMSFLPYLKREKDWNPKAKPLTDQFAPVNLLRGVPRQ